MALSPLTEPTYPLVSTPPIKFSKLYPNAVNKTWGLDSILHVFQPYANFSQLSTNSLDSSFRGIESINTLYTTQIS